MYNKYESTKSWREITELPIIVFNFWAMILGFYVFAVFSFFLLRAAKMYLHAKFWEEKSQVYGARLPFENHWIIVTN